MMTSSRDELISESAEPAVHIDHLRVVRGKRPALHDFSVQIARGSITGLLGPSGCGKTTLIRCIVGTQIVTSGTVTVLGKPAGSAELRRRVGYLPQDPTIYNDLWASGERCLSTTWSRPRRPSRPGPARRSRSTRSSRSGSISPLGDALRASWRRTGGGRWPGSCW